MKWVDKGCYSTKLLADSKDVSQEGVEIYLVKFDGGKYAHHHKQKTEFYYIVSGKGHVILEGERIELEKGVTVLCKPNMSHTFNDDGDLLMIGVKTNNDPNDTYKD